MTPATPPCGDPARYDGVQVLRAAAALLVLAAHVRPLSPVAWTWLGPWAQGGATIGVDVFFVISGFVMAAAADRPGVTARGFLLDRLTRVLPLYLVASLPYLLLGSTSWREAWNTFAFLPVFDGAAYTYPALLIGWSIAAELWFYLVFAAAILWAPEGRRVAVLAAAAAALVALGSLHAGSWVLPRFCGMPMFLEFAGGALLHRHRRALLGPAAAGLAPLGAALLFCAGAGWPALGGHIGYAVHTGGPLAAPGDPAMALLRVALWGGPALLLVAGVAALDRRGFRWPRPLVGLGDRSYSVYLVQPVAVPLLAPVAWAGAWSAWAALLALVLGMAWASHRWIERPATRWLRAALGRKRDAAGAPAAAAAAAAG